MNWNSNDTKYILKRFIIYILICVAMFIIGTWKVNAYEINQATIKPNMARFNTSGSSRDAYFNNKNMATYSLPGVYTDTLETLYLFFNTQEYYGYQNKFYQFSGHIYSSEKINITGVNVLDGSGKIVGACSYTGNGLDNIISWSANCWTPSGLRNGDYNNILEFSVNYGGTSPTSTNEIEIFFNSKVAMYDNYYTGGSTDITNAINQNTQAVQETNNTMKDSNVTTSDADDFTNNQEFSDSTGLESVIQLPLNMVNSLTSTCQPIQVTIPFIDYTGEIPCMSTIYRSKFNALYTIVKIVINGFFVYRLLLKVYELVHNAKQPDEDKLEVIEL